MKSVSLSTIVDGRQLVATLTDDLVWSGDEPLVSDAKRISSSLNYPGPAEGMPTHALVAKVATTLGATLHAPPVLDDGETVY